ncbi:hypothetical protein [Halorientalis salina]|uniref:hypothetical protein n=1 Tax=Halorientalis salina TaxID=2932266 RepID=UPI0010ACA863|nr:hypothetical protein [Halorientalis salina]
MNGQTLVERVREQKRTELDRLASDKALIAATEATLEASAVLGIIAESERAVGTLYAEWGEQTAIEDAMATFTTAADTARGNADRLAADLDDEATGAPITTTVAFDETVEAVAGGLIGQSLVLDGTLLQGINFFVNEGAERQADVLRDVRTDVNNRINDGAVLLTSLCETDEDWGRAETAIADVVEAAYGEYVERLGEMGIDPKPVC